MVLWPKQCMKSQQKTQSSLQEMQATTISYGYKAVRTYVINGINIGEIELSVVDVPRHNEAKHMASYCVVQAIQLKSKKTLS